MAKRSSTHLTPVGPASPAPGEERARRSSDRNRAPVPVVLADAPVAARAGVRAAVEPYGFTVVGEAGDAEAAVTAALEERPQLCIVASDLPGGGLDAAREISQRLPDTVIVVLGKTATAEGLSAAVEAGASAYLPRRSAAARLPDVLNSALDGYVSLPLQLVAGIVTQTGHGEGHPALAGIPATRFTQRERQVLEALLSGATTAEMASRLGISSVTVRRYVSQILRKTGVSDRDALIALRRGRST